MTQLKIQGLGRLKRLLAKGMMTKKVSAEIAKATGQNALMAQRLIRKSIQNGSYDKNADLTEAIKGSTKPLTGMRAIDLYNSIAIHRPRPSAAFVGILKRDENYNIAKTLHDGVEIEVTDKMRALFYVLWMVSIGRMSPSKLEGRAAELYEKYKDWKPLKDDTSHIVIPARPFITKPLGAGYKKQAQKRWIQAMKDGLFKASKK